MQNDADALFERALSAAFSADPASPDRKSATRKPLAARAAPPPIEIGPYRVVGSVGRGGMGSVYSAHDATLNRTVAIKLLHPHLADDPDMTRRFTEEARIGGGLQHPGVIPVHATGSAADGRPYMVMKLVEGRTFAALLETRSSPSTDRLEFLGLLERICQIAAFAHARGIAHLDLKPANVLIGAYGEVVLTDWAFGLGPERRADAPADRARIVGTPAYMAPEQARGDAEKIGPRSDVFALGAMLCEILTGAPPYVAETATEILLAASRVWLDDAHARLEASGADADLLQIARRCLAPAPENRPADAGEIAGALAAYLRSLEARAKAAAVAAAEADLRATSERRLRRIAARSAIVVVACLLGAGALWVRTDRDRAARVRREEHSAVETLERVRQLVDRARGAAEADPAAFEAAAAIASREADRAAARGAADDVVRRLRAAATEASTGRAEAATHRKLASELVAIHERRGDARDIGAKDREYEAIFIRLGLSLRPDGVAADAAIVGAHRLRDSLVDALDDWSHVRAGIPPRGPASVLRNIANSADPDSWRVRVRATAAERDVARIVALATSDERSEQPARSCILLARALRNVGEAAAATNILRDAERRFPDDYDLQHEIGNLLRDGPSPNATAALRHFSAALALRPRSAHARADVALGWIQAGDYAEGERHAVLAEEIDPDYAPGPYYAGVARSRRMLWDEAEAAFERSIALDPGFLPARWMLGVVRIRQGRFAEAEAAIRPCVAAAPNAHQYKISLAEAVAELGRRDEAMALYREALSATTDSATEWHNYGLLLRPDRLDEAAEAFGRAVEMNDKFAEAWCQLGIVRLEQGRFADGLKALERSHALGSLRPQWQLPTAELCTEARELLTAEEDLKNSDIEDLIDAEPDDARLHALVAAAARTGRPLVAARLLDEALRTVSAGFQIRPQTLLRGAAAAVVAGSAPTGLSAQESGAWRARGRQWLGAYVKALLSAGASARAAEVRAARSLLLEPEFESVRGTESLAALSEDERGRWAELWDSLRQFAGAPHPTAPR